MNAIRLNRAVLRGEIDNTRKDAVTVTLWLIGSSKPLIIQLKGNCLRDLAGTHIKFTHRPLDHHERMVLEEDTLRQGVVGEITASDRLSMHRPSKDGGYDAPTVVNVLRLEFFCDAGRVLLESYNFTPAFVSESWRMTVEEEFVQQACNFSAWQHYISESPFMDSVSHAQELANLYDEIQQRFAGQADFDHMEASLMGWNGVLDALVESGEPSPPNPLQDLSDLLTNGIDDILLDGEYFKSEGEEGVEGEESWEKDALRHPLLENIAELIEDFEEQASHLTFPRGRSYQSLINILDDIAEGLEGLLKPSDSVPAPADTSMIGCREYLGKMMIAFHHFSKLLEITETETGREELLYFRDALFEVREEISVLRFHLNNR